MCACNGRWEVDQSTASGNDALSCVRAAADSVFYCIKHKGHAIQYHVAAGHGAQLANNTAAMHKMQPRKMYVVDWTHCIIQPLLSAQVQKINRA